MNNEETRHRRVVLTPEIFRYVQAHNPPPDAILRDLKKETAEWTKMSMMQVAASQGTLLAMLVGLSGARNAVEVGTFTGYSAICIARALPSGGKLLCCDVDEGAASIARRYWARAGLTDVITLELGPAIETLRRATFDGPIDFAFIDADKENYRAYYEEILPRMAVGGLVVFDNTLWHGLVIDPTDHSEDTVAIRALNDFLVEDPRVDALMLPLFDGMSLARKR